ncbi:hypothetical protein HPB50_029261 [Hyalomma asiaticum]|nr:hypothetical protein HPB50_029261 [Hyalomma asiaticum]
MVANHCMVSFVKPGLLGTKNEFRNRFVNPIANGACADSTVHDVKLMKKRVHILHRLLDGCVQSDMGSFIDDGTVSEKSSSDNDDDAVICLDDDGPKTRSQRSDMGSFIDDETVSEKSSSDNDDDAVICLDDDGPKTRSQRRAKQKNDKDDGDGKDDKGDASSDEEVISSWQTRSRGNPDERSPTPPRPEKKQWWDQYISEEDMEKLQISGKMSLLYNILQECDAIGDKV